MRFLTPILFLALTACPSIEGPEPVNCVNLDTLELFHGTIIHAYALSDKSYIEYTDRNGFRRTITKENSDRWLCRKPKTESNNVTTTT